MGSSCQLGARNHAQVAGEVLPERINFSMCALGTKLLFFGGEAERGVALSDLHVVDLSHPTPFWQKLTLPKGAPQPAGRWGHTLRTVSVRALPCTHPPTPPTRKRTWRPSGKSLGGGEHKLRSGVA
jgi:hypothetical protein